MIVKYPGYRLLKDGPRSIKQALFSLASSPRLSKPYASADVVVPPQVGRQVRVAHVVTRLTLAGVGNVIASLIRGMPSERYQSAIWCLEEADMLGQILQADGLEVLELGKRWHRDLPLFLRIATRVREKQIDILHCHDELSWFYGAIGGLLSGRSRIVVTMHGRRPDISKRHLFEQWALAGITTTMVSVSLYLRQQIIDQVKVSPNKVVVIHNGVALDQLRPAPNLRHRARVALGLPADAIVVGCVGRLDTVKNLDLLIEAAARARVAVPSLYVVLIGDGPCRPHLVHKSTALGLHDKVIFTGVRQDVAELLPGLDLYVCSSDYEGISLSILEAMAAERAVIATAVGGNSEIIRHNENGILVEKGDRQALAQAIVALSHNVERRLRLGQQARCTVEAQFSLNRMIQAYNCLYHLTGHTAVHD